MSVILDEINTSIEKILIKLLIKSIKWKKYTIKTKKIKNSKYAFILCKIPIISKLAL